MGVKSAEIRGKKEIIAQVEGFWVFLFVFLHRRLLQQVSQKNMARGIQWGKGFEKRWCSGVKTDKTLTRHSHFDLNFSFPSYPIINSRHSSFRNIY